jgi:hypothetical protein
MVDLDDADKRIPPILSRLICLFGSCDGKYLFLYQSIDHFQAFVGEIPFISVFWKGFWLGIE